ncbi:thioester domain-containing protein [Streptomonospora algeriensis]|uniref:Thioester domain-containing protein n=1 Tax=Streptomonospora algeriensis TaxID=995084 RepID=A0ABW3BCZ1_9ACTN
MSGLLRRCLAVAAAALAVAAGAPAPVSAQDLSRVAPDTEQGATLRLKGGGAATTSLYRLTVGEDTSVEAYCADISTSVNTEAAYTGAAWGSDAAPEVDAAAPGALTWITERSYPSVELERLRAESGVQGLSRPQAIAATQAAIWHHTNGVDLQPASERGSGNAATVVSLYDYLLEGARQHSEEVPGAPLELTPGRVEGADPEKPIGPLTVRTTSPGPVAVWVRGARHGQLTGAGGDPVDLVHDGEEFFLRLPAEAPAGVATVYAKVTDARVRPGRLFVGKNGVETQPLVVAESAVAVANAAVKVDWVYDGGPVDAQPRPEPSASAPAPGKAGGAEPPSAPPATSPGATRSASPSPEEVVVAEDRRPDDHLARTGTWVGTAVIVGLALVALGAAALYLSRRRRAL